MLGGPPPDVSVNIQTSWIGAHCEMQVRNVSSKTWGGGGGGGVGLAPVATPVSTPMHVDHA